MWILCKNHENSTNIIKESLKKCDYSQRITKSMQMSSKIREKKQISLKNSPKKCKYRQRIGLRFHFKIKGEGWTKYTNDSAIFNKVYSKFIQIFFFTFLIQFIIIIISFYDFFFTFIKEIWCPLPISNQIKLDLLRFFYFDKIKI